MGLSEPRRAAAGLPATVGWRAQAHGGHRTFGQPGTWAAPVLLPGKGVV